MARVSRELNQTMSAKRTQDASDMTALGLITTAWGKNWIPRSCNLDSFQAHASSSDQTLSLGKDGTSIPLSFHQGF